MIFVTGPLYAGKREYIRQTLGLSQEEFCQRAIWNVQDLAADAADLSALAQQLSQKEIIIATEIGGGVVPIDPKERNAREAAGRLSCMLAQRAETVIRVYCGLAQILKGELPC